jgi:hypothetical protein
VFPSAEYALHVDGEFAAAEGHRTASSAHVKDGVIMPSQPSRTAAMRVVEASLADHAA